MNKVLIYKTINLVQPLAPVSKMDQSNIMSEKKKIHNKFITMIFMESQEFHDLTSVSMLYNGSQLLLVVNTSISDEIHFVFIETHQLSYRYKIYMVIKTQM